MDRDEVVERFLAHATPALGRERAGCAVEKILRLERLGDVRDLTALLRTA